MGPIETAGLGVALWIAVGVYLDARKRTSRDGNNLAALGWAIGSLLFAIVAVPLYLLVRRRGQGPGSPAGLSMIGVGVAAVGFLLILGLTQDDQSSDTQGRMEAIAEEVADEQGQNLVYGAVISRNQRVGCLAIYNDRTGYVAMECGLVDGDAGWELGVEGAAKSTEWMWPIEGVPVRQMGPGEPFTAAYAGSLVPGSDPPACEFGDDGGVRCENESDTFRIE